MITLKEACEIVKSHMPKYKIVNVKIIKNAWVFEICEISGEIDLDISGIPVVYKDTGKFEFVFPPQNPWVLEKGKKVRVPA